MGGGSKSTSNSYSGSSTPAFQPYAISGVNSVNQVYDQAAPGLQALSNNLTSSVIPGLQSQATGAAGVAGQAQGYNSDVLSGKYLNGNPYLQHIIDQTNSDIGNQVGSHFSVNGRYGSGANQAVMAKQMSNNDASLRYANYGDERNQMTQAAGAAQQANLGDYASLLQAIGQGAELPYTGANNLANQLGALFNGGTSSSKEKGANPIWGAIGAGLGAAGTAIGGSDPRLKTNIVRIGEWDERGDGLGKYEWNWKADPNGEKVIGVLSTEVAELRPQAHVPNFRGDGYDGVNYAALAA